MAKKKWSNILFETLWKQSQFNLVFIDYWLRFLATSIFFYLNMFHGPWSQLYKHTHQRELNNVSWACFVLPQKTRISKLILVFGSSVKGSQNNPALLTPAALGLQSEMTSKYTRIYLPRGASWALCPWTFGGQFQGLKIVRRPKVIH